MSKSMLINVVNEEESRVAIVADGVLEALSVETSLHEQIEGNIYKAKIAKVMPGLDAVFVDYGAARNGFLAVPDIRSRYFPEGKRDINRLRQGQELLVQVRKGEIGQKGAALTTYLSLPGRHFVLTPFSNKRGVSRKIEDESTRDQLRRILDDAGIPEDMGYIARTAAEGRTKQDLQRDAGYLLRLWKRIQHGEAEVRGPALLYQDSDIVIRTIRDYFTPAVSEVWVDDKDVCDQVHSFFQAVMPWHQRRVKLYQGQKPLFSKYNLEDQIASIHEKKVSLPSGGSIVIERTEALVSVDVNSGKSTQGKDIEETAFTTNVEAAEEAVRQLRLRDLGGLVVIDFIDMRSAKNRNEVRKALQKALKEDKARTDLGTISKFGLLELSRQRIKPAGELKASVACPTCGGAGTLRSPETFGLSLLRRIQWTLARRPQGLRVRAGVGADVAALLLNRKRETILEFEREFRGSVDIFPEAALQPNQYYVEYRENSSSWVETNLPEEFPKGSLKAAKGLPDAAAKPLRQPAYALADAAVEPEPEAPAEAAADAEPKPAPAKKKRRRRRKSASGGATTAAGDTAGGEEPPVAEPPTAAEAAAPVPAGETPGETSSGGLFAAARRWLTGRLEREADQPSPAGRDETGPTTATPAAEPELEPAAAAEPVGETPATEPAAATPAAASAAKGPSRSSRRRRSRRSGKATAATPAQPAETPGPSTAGAGASPEEAAAAPAPAATEATEPAPATAAEGSARKRRRSRPRRGKGKTAAEATAGSGDSVAPAPVEAEQKPSANAPTPAADTAAPPAQGEAPKRSSSSRRRRRPTSRAKAGQEAAGSGAGSGSAEGSPGGTEPPAEGGSGTSDAS